MLHFLASEQDFFIANFVFFIYRISICTIVHVMMEPETERVERIHTSSSSSSSSSPKKIFSNDDSPDHAADNQLDQLNDGGSTLHINNGCEGDLSNKNNVSEQPTNVDDINCERSEDFAVKDEMLSEDYSGQNVAEDESLSNEQHMQASKENIL